MTHTHTAYPDGHEEVWGKLSLGSNWASEWHEFAVERSASGIVFAINGTVIVNSSAYDPPAQKCTTANGSDGTCVALSQCGVGANLVSSVCSGAEECCMNNELLGDRKSVRDMDPSPVDDIKLWPIPFYLILNTAVRCALC